MSVPDSPWRETADAATRMQKFLTAIGVSAMTIVQYFLARADRRPRRVPRLLRQRRLRMKGRIT
jgi:hypothetical protein